MSNGHKPRCDAIENESDFVENEFKRDREEQNAILFRCQDAGLNKEDRISGFVKIEIFLGKEHILKEIIGNVGCTFYEDTGKVGICYFAGTQFRKKGYVSEAVKAYIPYFFEKYNESEIFATILDSNTASWKTAESVGFKLLEMKMYKDIYDEEEKLYRFYVKNST